jgi:hypothetical protein
MPFKPFFTTSSESVKDPENIYRKLPWLWSTGKNIHIHADVDLWIGIFGTFLSYQRRKWLFLPQFYKANHPVPSNLLKGFSVPKIRSNIYILCCLAATSLKPWTSFRTRKKMSDNRKAPANTLFAEREMLYQNIFCHCNSWLIFMIEICPKHVN